MSSCLRKSIYSGLLLYIALIVTASCAFADFDTDPFYDQRVKLDAPPIDAISEHIDPFSGNMLIVQTDLHLPGNGGLDVTLMRTYNSMIYSRRDDTLSDMYFVAKKDKSPMGIGWTMHMGILRYPNTPGTTWGNCPILELPDGTKQIFFQDKLDPSRLISKDYWILKPGQQYGYSGQGDYEVRSPQGVIYTFTNYTAAGYKTTDLKDVAQVVKIQNPAGTATIDITYDKASNSNESYLKTITDTVGRVITFNYDSTVPYKRLTSVTTDTRIISYTYKTVGSLDPISLLETVTLPEKHSLNNGTYDWKYGYDTTNELNEIDYPTGGIVKYTYTDVSFKTGDICNLPYRVVTQKDTSDRGITAGTWAYHYNYNGTPNTTVINAPNNTTETHKFYGWGSGNVSSGTVWKVGLPISREFSFNGATLSESFGWVAGSSISNTNISNINWGCPSWLVTDNRNVYPAVLSTKSVTRDGKTYTTTNSNFNSYGDPQTITETGDTTRTKVLTYCTSPSLNIVKGKPATESVTGSSFTGTSTASWDYGSPSDCINPTKITKNGVVTNYEYYPKSYASKSSTLQDGNLKKITDANGHTLTYEWTYGKISKETNSLPSPDTYSVSREINVNGTIKNETDGRGTGHTTGYLYDDNLRLEHITPQIGNQTTISYATDGSTRTETRGGFSSIYYFDGFARPTGSSDGRGVTTTIAYNAYGIKESTSSNIGDTTDFDFFGRPTQVTDQDGYNESYDYSAVSNKTSVTVTDKNNKTYTLTFNAFGNPDEKYLMSVVDQDSKTTTYTRNILGNLTGVTQGNGSAGSVTRSFAYGLKTTQTTDLTKPAFLVSETNPETGTVSYIRDNVGNIYQKTDATGTATYVHDEINRLKSISKNSESISFEYDKADNKHKVTSGAATITYDHDEVNRLHTKTETIAGKTYTTSYEYNGNDVIKQITYPSTRVVDYVINTKNQVESITGFVDPVKYYTSGIHSGLPDYFTLANGVTTTFTYNNRQLITDISAGSALTAHYGHDTRGNTNSFTSTVGSAQSFTYDNLSRLETFSGSWGSGSFTYYPNGNRWTKSVGGAPITTYYYNNNNSNNRLDYATGSEAATYSYNGNGVLTGGTWGGSSYTLTPDAFGNLTSFQSGTTTLASFAYDGDGQRVTKTADGKTTVYHYDQAGHIISEDDGNGGPIADYVYLNGKLVAKVVAEPTLTVSKDGSGTGTVTSNSGNLSCGSTCSASFAKGTSVTLTATAGNNSIFTGWSGGGCTGTGTCTIPLNAATDVKATFAWLGPFTISVAPSGCGTISPAGPVTVNYGGSQTFYIQSSIGSDLLDVQVDGVSVGAVSSYILSDVTADHSIVAIFSNPDGDANSDGSVNVADALLTLRIAVGIAFATPTIKSHADVGPFDINRNPEPDGQITVLDTLLILRKALGISSWNLLCNALSKTTAKAVSDINSNAVITLIPLGNGFYNIQGANMDGVAGIQMNIAYDTSTLSTPSIAQGSLTSGATLEANTITDPGYLTVGIISSTAFSGSGTIATVNFASWDGSSSTPTIMKYELVDSNGRLIRSVGGLITISTTALADGITGSSYNQPVVATGGISLKAWSITSGSLPTGLTLDSSTGVISGTPSATGNYVFTIQVRDNYGNQASKSFSINILSNDTTPPITTATPSGNLYTSAQTVTLSTNEQATVYYTTDGSTPTTSSAIYSSPLVISVTTTLKYFARDVASNSETVKSQTYVIDTIPPVTTTSVPSGTYSSAFTVALSTNEPATIYYTTNGTTPTTSSAVYTTPLTISSSATLKYFARDAAGNNEPVKYQTYVILSGAGIRYTENFSAPAIPAGYSGQGPISITNSAYNSAANSLMLGNGFDTDGAVSFVAPVSGNLTFWYTKVSEWGYYYEDGYWEAVGSNVGAMIISVNGNVAYTTSSDIGWTLSPMISVNAGDTIQITQAGNLDDGAAYCGNFYRGRCPSTEDPYYNVSVYVDDITITGFAGSDMAAPVTTATPNGGSYATAKTVTLSTSETAKIYYTIDGSIPSTSSPEYTAPLTIASTTVLKYFARDTSYNSEAVKTQTYIIDTIAPVTTAAPASGTYSAAQTVTLSTDETATIYYTTNGSTPTTTSAVYTNPLLISASTTLKYFAKDTVGNVEAVKSQSYTIDSTAPSTTASPAGGTYSSTQTVTLSASEAATIYFTVDGTTPTTSSPTYTTPLTITATTVLKYFAKDAAGNTEAVKSQTYTISGPSGSIVQSTPGIYSHTFTASTTVTVSYLNGAGGGGATYDDWGGDGESSYISRAGVTLATAYGGGGGTHSGSGISIGTATNSIGGSNVTGGGGSGGGGSDGYSDGGSGGAVRGGSFPVSAGQTVTIYVGSGGGDGNGDVSGQDGSVSLSWN